MAAKPALQQPGFDVSRLYVWVKGLETKANNLLREVDVLKNDFILKNNELKRELKVLNEDLLNVKHEQGQTLRKMDLIIKELKQTAGVEEVQVLKKYVELWNPMNFVTQRDLARAVDARLGEDAFMEKHKNSPDLPPATGDS